MQLDPVETSIMNPRRDPETLKCHSKMCLRSEMCLWQHLGGSGLNEIEIHVGICVGIEVYISNLSISNTIRDSRYYPYRAESQDLFQNLAISKRAICSMLIIL